MEFQLSSLLSTNELSSVRLENRILDLNDELALKGLIISADEAETLVKTSRECLAASGRLEFGDSITLKLINRFMDSTQVNREDFAGTIDALIAIFYEIKDECEDSLGDDEIIDLMLQLFDGKCGGDVYLLMNNEVFELCRAARMKKMGYAVETPEIENGNDEDGDANEQ